jgi:hypothetical protein
MFLYLPVALRATCHEIEVSLSSQFPSIHASLLVSPTYWRSAHTCYQSCQWEPRQNLSKLFPTTIHNIWNATPYFVPTDVNKVIKWKSSSTTGCRYIHSLCIVKLGLRVIRRCHDTFSYPCFLIRYWAARIAEEQHIGAGTIPPTPLRKGKNRVSKDKSNTSCESLPLQPCMTQNNWPLDPACR